MTSRLSQGFISSVNVEPTIDTSVGSEEKIHQITCKISCLTEKNNFKISVIAGKLSTTVEVEIDAATTKEISLFLPPLEEDSPVETDMSISVSTNKATESHFCKCTLIPQNYFDTQSRMRAALLARKVSPFDDTLAYFTKIDGGVMETLEKKGIVIPPRTLSEKMATLKIVFDAIVDISRESIPGGKIVRLRNVSEVLEEDSGNIFELSCLFVSLTNLFGIDSIILLLEKECIAGIVAPELNSYGGEDENTYGLFFEEGRERKFLKIIPVNLFSREVYDSIDSALYKLDRSNMLINDRSNHCYFFVGML